MGGAKGKEGKKISKLEQWQTENGLVLLKGWAREGMSLGQIAKRCGVSEQMLNRWQKQDKEIANALAQSRELADRMLEDALYERAKGYTVLVEKQVKCKQVDYDPNTGKKLREWEEMVPVKEEVYVAGNMTAMQFWLKNRKPEIWKQSGVGQIKEEETEIIDDI